MILTRKYEKDLQLNWPLKYDTVFTNWSSLKSLNCSCLKIDLCLLWRWLPLACAWYKSQFSRYYFVWALSVVNLRHTYFIHFNTVKSSLNSTHGNLSLYGSHKRGLRYTLSKFGNCVTKVCIITWFLRKKSHIWSVLLRRNSSPACGYFCQDFDKKTWERLTTYLATEIQYDLRTLNI